MPPSSPASSPDPTFRPTPPAPPVTPEIRAARALQRRLGTVVDEASLSMLHYHDGTLIRARVPRYWNGRIACVFDSAQQPPRLADPGFGEAFLLSRGFGVCAFRSLRNTWYDWLDDTLIERVAAWLDAQGTGEGTARDGTQGAVPGRTGERIGYGSSMGGYGAIRFSRALGLTRIVAHSPQASITAPFETRYGRFASMATRHVPVSAAHIAPDARFEIYYDPANRTDALQVELLARAIGDRAAFIPLRHAGHPTTRALHEAKLLKPAIARAITPGEWASRRGRSASYLERLALGNLARRPRWARSLMEHAVALEPADGACRWRLARALLATHERRGALVQAEIGLALAPYHAHLMLLVARLLPPADARRARDLVERALGRQGHDPAIVVGVAAVLKRLDASEGGGADGVTDRGTPSEPAPLEPAPSEPATDG